jgi:hypothetical protein
MSEQTVSIKSASLQDLSAILVLYDILKDSDQWSDDNTHPTCIYTVTDREAEHAFRLLCLRMMDFMDSMDRLADDGDFADIWHRDDEGFRPGIVEVLEQVLEYFRRAKGKEPL